MYIQNFTPLQQSLLENKRNRTDRRTDGQTDRQTDRSSYRGGAHLKRGKWKLNIYKYIFSMSKINRLIGENFLELN